MASRKILRAAVIGCGRIGAFTVHKPGDDLPARYFPTNHCAAIRAAEGIRLVAVCDYSISAAKKAAKLHKVKHIYTDFKKMILNESPDIIAIATRTAGRTDVIEFAAKHGVKGMHIEKPLATSLKDAKKSLNAIKRNKIAVSYGAVRRYMPVYRQAKEMMLSGKFGKFKKIIIDIPKSPLMWAHPHTVDLINYFTDNADVEYVESSFEYDKNDVGKNKIDLDPVLDFGIVKFKKGSSALLNDEGGKCVRLVCEKGEIIINIGGKNLKTKTNGGKIKNIKIKSDISGRVNAIAELREHINDGNPTSINTDALLTEQKVIFALGYSGITGRKIRLSKIKDSFTVTGRTGNLYP